MDDKELLDIYTDYLISSFGLTTGTGLSRLLDGAISHDRIQRFLSSPTKGGADFWKIVKPYVRQIQAAEGVMIVDDSISEKPHTDENEIVCWHYDHTNGATNQRHQLHHGTVSYQRGVAAAERSSGRQNRSLSRPPNRQTEASGNGDEKRTLPTTSAAGGSELDPIPLCGE